MNGSILDPFEQRVSITCPFQSDGAIRFEMFLGEVEGEEGAAGHSRAIEDECGIGFDDILFGANGVVIGLEFNERVMRWNRTIFGPSSSGAKSPVR